MHPTLTVERITPKLATEWLDLNVDNNRPVREGKVMKYAAAMLDGRWLTTSATIKFNQAGALIDGQHRLRAVVQSGLAVDMAVSRGEHMDAIYIIDTQTARNARDALVVAGMYSATNASKIAGLANALHGWEEGVYDTAFASLSTGDRFENDEMLAYVAEHQDDLEPALEIADSVLRTLPMNRSGVGVAYLVLREVDEDAAEEFFTRLVNGQFGGVEDPLFSLMRRVNRDRLIPGTHPEVGTTLYLLIRTWNAWRSGEGAIKFQYGSKASGYTRMPRPV